MFRSTTTREIDDLHCVCLCVSVCVCVCLCVSVCVCVCPGRPHRPPPGRAEVSGRGGPLPPQAPLPPGPAGSPWQHAAAHRLQGRKPAHRHGDLQRQGEPGPRQQGEDVVLPFVRLMSSHTLEGISVQNSWTRG